MQAPKRRTSLPDGAKAPDAVAGDGAEVPVAEPADGAGAGEPAAAVTLVVVLFIDYLFSD